MAQSRAPHSQAGLLAHGLAPTQTFHSLCRDDGRLSSRHPVYSGATAAEYSLPSLLNRIGTWGAIKLLSYIAHLGFRPILCYLYQPRLSRLRVERQGLSIVLAQDHCSGSLLKQTPAHPEPVPKPVPNPLTVSVSKDRLTVDARPSLLPGHRPSAGSWRTSAGFWKPWAGLLSGNTYCRDCSGKTAYAPVPPHRIPGMEPARLPPAHSVRLTHPVP